MIEFIAMTDLEKYNPKERGSRLYETTGRATRMIVERITLENLGLDFKKLPLCTESDADLIEEFIPRAKDGFALSLRANKVLPDEIEKLLELTTPIAIPSQDNRIKMSEKENTLPEYGHTVATLAYLLSLRKVTFFDFTDPPKDVDYELGLIETYWNFNLFSVDHIWTKMLEIEDITRAALYQRESMEISDLLKIGHFFAAGNQLSKIFC